MKDARRAAAAFTILELLAAVVILSVILVLVLQISSLISTTWKHSTSKIEGFQAARAAFDTISSQLGQATLNAYYDYDSATAPTRYLRKSDLHFISGKALVPGQITHAVFFQVPLGSTDKTAYQNLGGLLNGCGYYVQYGADPERPSFLASLPNTAPPLRRFRLMQFLQPAQQLAIYDPALGAGRLWFTTPLASSSPPSHPLAENVIALVILPRAASTDTGGIVLAPDYEYDSRATSATAANSTQKPNENQLPPLVDLILVAIDETSALHLGNTEGAPDLGTANLFKTASLLENDLKQIGATLSGRHLSYRVYRTTVVMKGAKWGL
ncbi:Verru_Chthon cassette protein C [Verrucomicrobium sp. GAS474]|uniref:Verru_Chthon cassette protein C n=1 Tax=Verrucomicrobium sp. GAS474 TaxID=1882831 RepID=UPI00087AC9EB|nr:Verru_Chthon cassette protein C [Verrucomicrobium sp. GAS474]SDU03010.1 Verru_Chthon cassette protein C [Verrucomicrobium sp. GAS474]